MSERRTDFEWLRDFTRLGDQKAFANIVRRHLDLVYATALRKLEDPGAAEEVAQSVFTILARKAWRFAPDDSLPAWLYRATLIEARAWWRGELRRRRRERTAAELGTTMKIPEEQTACRTLVPLLDEALLSLREKDRTALLLRFYERRSLREVGAALGVSEDTAQKRVAGAVERLARFFQRRGFKTATAGAAAAALEQTAASASAATTAAVIIGAIQSAPPALTGIGAGLARLASLSKAQTAALCVALAAAPVAWQLKAHHAAKADARQMQTRLLAAQTERTTLQTEIERLRAESERLNQSIAQENRAATRDTVSAQKFDDWKARIRSGLLSDHYRWPTDSPFVRIPKSALPQINVNGTVVPPGTLTEQASELLGLTPEERQQIEDALHDHFATLNRLVDSAIYETNRAERFQVPTSAVASEVWVVPPLSDEFKFSGDELETTLRSVLGDARWPLVKSQLASSGMGTLRSVLDLDANKHSQTVAVWINKRAGHFLVYSGWSSRYSTSTGGGVTLGAFLPGAEVSVEPGTTDPRRFFAYYHLPTSLEQRVMTWIRRQAVSRLGKQTGP